MIEKLTLPLDGETLVIPRQTPFYLRQNFLVPFCIITVSLLLRFLIMPITYHHSDFTLLTWSARTFTLGNWDVYDAGLKLWVQDARYAGLESPLSHGPLYYYPYGAWLWLINFLGIFSVKDWAVPPVNSTSYSPLILILFKLPSLLADLLSAFFISRIFPAGKRNLGLGLWLLAPSTTYITYASGQDDIFMITCICGSLYFASKYFKSVAQREEQNLAPLSLFSEKNALLAMTMLGVGTCFKLFALFLIPVMLLILAKRTDYTLRQDYKRAILLLGSGLAPIAIIFIPLALTSKLFLTSLLASHEANGLATLTYTTGLGVMSLFWVLYFTLLAFLVVNNFRTPYQFSFNHLVLYSALLSFIYMAVSRYPITFTLWILPFIVIIVAQRPQLLICYLIFTFSQVLNLLLVNGFDPISLWAVREPNSSGLPVDYLTKLIPLDQILSIIGPLAVVSLFTMLFCYSWSFIAFPQWQWLKQVNFTRRKAGLNDAVFSKRWSLGLTIAAPLILFTVMMLGLSIISLNANGTRVVNQATGDFTSPFVLSAGNTVQQNFLADVGQLDKLDLVFGTYGHYNSVKVDFNLYQEGNPTPIYTTQIDGLYVQNDTFYSIKLPQPLTLTKPTPLYFTLSSPDATAHNLLALSNTTMDKILGNTIKVVSGAKEDGVASNKVLKFRVNYSIDWGLRWKDTFDYLGRTPVFSSLWYGLCVVLGILFVLSLRLIYVRNKPDRSTK